MIPKPSLGPPKVGKGKNIESCDINELYNKIVYQPDKKDHRDKGRRESGMLKGAEKYFDFSGRPFASENKKVEARLVAEIRLNKQIQDLIQSDKSLLDMYSLQGEEDISLDEIETDLRRNFIKGSGTVPHIPKMD